MATKSPTGVKTIDCSRRRQGWTSNCNDLRSFAWWVTGLEITIRGAGWTARVYDYAIEQFDSAKLRRTKHCESRNVSGPARAMKSAASGTTTEKLTSASRSSHLKKYYRILDPVKCLSKFDLEGLHRKHRTQFDIFCLTMSTFLHIFSNSPSVFWHVHNKLQNAENLTFFAAFGFEK
jgi:hypothetical protein